jgi:co-chaperonin GroES (HSP10)
VGCHLPVSKIIKLKTKKRKTEVKDGVVIKCGEGVKVVSPGDNIVFSGYAGRRIKKDGYEFLMMDEGEIMGVQA